MAVNEPIPRAQPEGEVCLHTVDYEKILLVTKISRLTVYLYFVDGPMEDAPSHDHVYSKPHPQLKCMLGTLLYTPLLYITLYEILNGIQCLPCN